MKRIYYKDGTYKDAPSPHAGWYENDPGWDHTEDLEPMTALAETILDDEPRKSTMTLEAMEESRRLKVVVFSVDFFLAMFHQGRRGRYFKVDEPGLPEDAAIVGWSEHIRFGSGQVAVKVWSASFDPVPEGGTIPEIEVWLRAVEVKAVPSATDVLCVLCRGCGSVLFTANFDKVADGCPCNSERGINHGLVPKNTCTCPECDPNRTGVARSPTQSPRGGFF